MVRSGNARRLRLVAVLTLSSLGLLALSGCINLLLGDALAELLSRAMEELPPLQPTDPQGGGGLLEIRLEPLTGM